MTNVRQIFIDGEQRLDFFIRGGVECSVSVGLTTLTAIASEIITFIGYSVTVGLFASSLQPLSALRFTHGGIRIAGGLTILGFRYILQYAEGKCYHSFRNWFIGGTKKLDFALKGVRETRAFKVARVTLPILAVCLSPISPMIPLAYCTIAVTVVTIQSYKSAAPSYEKFQEFKRKHPKTVYALWIAARVAQFSLPLLSMIAYKTIGVAPFPAFFLAHTLSMLIIPLKEVLIQLEVDPPVVDCPV